MAPAQAAARPEDASQDKHIIGICVPLCRSPHHSESCATAEGDYSPCSGTKVGCRMATGGRTPGTGTGPNPWTLRH